MIREDRNSEAPAPQPKNVLQSPARLLAIVVISILATEIGLMFSFELLPPHSTLVENLLDGVLLIVLLTPVLYLFLFRPLRAYITELQQTQELLQQQRNLLKEQVLQRTAELSHSNDALRASLTEIDDLYQNAPCGYHSTDKDGVIVKINDTELSWLGYTREEMVGKLRFYDLLTSESAVSFWENFSRLNKSGSLTGLEACLLTKDGRRISALINASAVRDEHGQYVMSRCTVYDISERKQTEVAQKRLNRALLLLSKCNTALVLAEEEQTLLDSICRLVVDTGGYLMAWVGFAESDAARSIRPVAMSGLANEYLNNNPITWADTELGRGPTGTAIRVGVTQINQDTLHNPAMARWRDAALMVGYRSSIALPLSGKDHMLGALTIYSAEPGAFVADEIQLLEELASNLSFGIETLRVRAANAAAQQELYIHRRNLEELVAERTIELASAKREAENANTAKSRFLAAASHDLRQPLSALNLYVGVLKNKLDPREYGLLKDMDECVSGLSDLLSKLLDLSKLEAGVVSPRVSDFAVDEMLNKVISTHAPEAEAKGLSLRCGSFGLTARTDPVLFQRIVGNLVSNAIRYTRRGSVLIACRRHHGKRWIEVWDTGIGIPPGKTGEIFEEFKQLEDDARTRGSGLGLAIVAKTANLLGLEMRVQSRYRRGSMFAIELPLGIRQPARLQPGDQKHPARSLRIAVVDDNPAVLNALALALEEAGHKVVAACSGTELLARLGSHPPDIMVCDYRLGAGETGFDVITSIRQGFGPRLPAIIITGDTDPTLMRSMAEKGIVIQHKPLELEELKARIEEGARA